MIKIHMNINRRQKYVWTSDSSGFTLVEVIVYIAIFSMIAVTLISLAYISSVEDHKTIQAVINAYENI